ncbi:helix-turn-helix domain-containing protein [bacterium SCSIO 12643]|nr:helix-turn-helix domain-containing protein [bacterium SCSIO 12643]
MKKDIPHIKFDKKDDVQFEFEIVPIQKISKNKNQYTHSPELPHQVKFYNLIFFTSGTGRHFIDFNWYPVQENTLVYLAKEQVNAFDFSNDLDGYCIIFTEKHFVQCFPNLPEDLVFRLFNPQLFSPILQIPLESAFNSYFKLLKEEYHNSNIFNKQTVINALFTILISKAEQIKQKQPFHIKDNSKIVVFQKFNSLIEENLMISRSANFYANELGITYKHLNSICKELMNKTAKNVIDDLVILKAKRILINSDIKSTELAYKLGFEDPTNFTKYFKKNTSLTPKSFIKSILNE